MPTKEQAISELNILSSYGYASEKYNPDTLMGRQGFPIYKRMLNDEQIKAVLKFKRDAITSRKFKFELDTDEIPEKEIEKRIEISEQYIQQLNGSWMDALNGIMTGMSYGFSMNEKIWHKIEYKNLTYWGLKQLKLRPFDTFYFKVDEFGNVKEVVQKVSGKENKINPSKFVHFVVNPDVDEHYGQSELRECYRAWFSKDQVIKFRNIWLERHAGGFTTIKPINGKTLSANSAEYVRLQDVLANINTRTGMILPSNLELELHSPSNNVAFKEAIEDFNMSIARALLVPNLLGVSPQGNHGSLAQADSQIEAFMWTLEADSRRLEEALNEQLFAQLGEVNFGDLYFPKYKMQPVSDRSKYELITAWKELISGGAVTHTSSDEAHLREMLEFPEREEDEDTSLPPTNPPPGNDEQPTAQPNDKDGDANPDKPATGAEKTDLNETVSGKGLVSISAFSAAERRVDFAVIARNSDSITDEYTNASAEVMDIIVADLISKAKEGGELDSDVTDNIKNVKVDAKLKQKLNRVQSSMLKEGYAVGHKHASIEIDKAKKQAYSVNFNKQRIDLISADYFKMRAFKITGDLTSEAESIIEQEILNGAKYNKTWAEVERSIYSVFATKGMISLDQAKEALGEALNVNSPDARLRTIVRTSTFDAINEARHGYFTDPELGDYVQAFEYSAILDDRTTSICRHLDDENRGNHSKQWYESNPQFKPPNHHNCRSLLIPVTVDDMGSFEEGGEPTIQPQGGFK